MVNSLSRSLFPTSYKDLRRKNLRLKKLPITREASLSFSGRSRYRLETCFPIKLASSCPMHQGSRADCRRFYKTYFFVADAVDE
jgi:hypothetical protein